MAVQPTYPGVYIQEVPSGVRTIAGVATSIAMFVGRTESGIMDRPTRVFNFTEFKEKFGDGTQQSEMAHQVRQFFQNGGNQAYVMRIAEGASEASVDLNNEAENTVLRATAKEAGRAGERIRIEVDYDTPEPDKTFNMRIFRMVENGAGGFSEEDQEEYPNLTMDSTQARYAPDVVTQGSKLIEFTESDPVEVESSSGVSVAGRVLGDNPLSDLNTIINTEGWSMLRISLGGDFETVDLSEMGDITSFSDSNEFTNNLNPLLSLGEVTVGFVNIGEGRNLFVIRNNTANDISIEPTEDPENDFSTAMQLGIERGGIEIGAHAFRRPAPSSLFFSYGGTDVSNLEELFGNLGTFATSNQGGLTEITVNGQTISELDLGTTESDDLMLQGRAGPEPDSFSLDNVREKVRELEAQFNDRAVATADFDWELRVQGASPQGLRIVLKPTAGDANVGRGASVGATIIGDAFVTIVCVI